MSLPEDATPGFRIIKEWMQSMGIQPFDFQKETWQKMQQGYSGLVNAPTGYGKTFSVFLGTLIRYINEYPDDFQTRENAGLQLIWVTPLRALAKDIGRAMKDALEQINMPWKIGIRNGDTDVKERQKQKKQMPEILIITPESLHLILAQKGNKEIFRNIKTIAVDEWHELLGSKRGVQVELALATILHYSTENIQLWGISATIGNLDEAMNVLLHPVLEKNKTVIITANIKKEIIIDSIYPDEIEKYPWAGHLGIKLAHKVVPIIEQSKTTLIFINTRGMSEMWYQTLLDEAPQLAGSIALHHGSIEQELRIWVEEALHQGKLKAVVCTASLDLGVDFRPVETVIQVGSPKGVARFLQRAGRSGHQPGQASRIHFLPTHSLELIEAAALKEAIQYNTIESKDPLLLCFDVLIQFMGTLAIGDGFKAQELFEITKSTHCFADITLDEWNQTLYFLTNGGHALQQYDEFRKVEVDESGIYRINSRRIAMRHRMHIGTIVSDALLRVKWITGGYIGVIEEWFISKLVPGDVFTLAGRNLEFIMIKDMHVLVRKSKSTKSIVPSWMGGRMPMSANLGTMLRKKLNEAGRENSIDLKNNHRSSFDTLYQNKTTDEEIEKLKPLFQRQLETSHIPQENELLIEHIETKDGYHVFVHTFEGRLVNEAMAAILAYRISRITPISFSFAMNDYSFELLSDQPIPIDDSNVYDLFSTENLYTDIQKSVNSTEMARRKFRDISVIGGLVFQGFPGEHKKTKHLQASASLLFNVFTEYEKDNLLLRQAYQEVFDQQMEEVRLRQMLERIKESKIIITFPTELTPFSFPVKVDSLRENISSEKLEDRVKRMQIAIEKGRKK